MRFLFCYMGILLIHKNHLSGLPRFLYCYVSIIKLFILWHNCPLHQF
uniref:Uncharacterized protein n=1 Tax=Arundo donax TaxID=35708 RepID=A0A0A9CIV3_ARUDO